MGRIWTIAIATGTLAAMAVPALAEDKDKARETPKLFADAIACRDIAAADQRLACYDAAVAALAAAEEKEDIVVASREEIRETRRGLFGLKLPVIKLFGGGGDDADEEEFSTLESTVKQVRSIGGDFAFVLEDGAVWQKTDSGYLSKPKDGAKIVIRRAALGSYFARINDGLGFRVKRIQ